MGLERKTGTFQQNLQRATDPVQNEHSASTEHGKVDYAETMSGLGQDKKNRKFTHAGARIPMKVKFSSFIKEVSGRMGNTIFRLCHAAEWQITRRPNMSRIKWSQAQQEQRERMAKAIAYANRAKPFPERREFYLQMAWEKKRNKRWYEWPSHTITTSTGWGRACGDYFTHLISTSVFFRSIYHLEVSAKLD
jgi:hypothetical protein